MKAYSTQLVVLQFLCWLQHVHQQSYAFTAIHSSIQNTRKRSYVNNLTTSKSRRWKRQYYRKEGPGLFAPKSRLWSSEMESNMKHSAHSHPVNNLLGNKKRVLSAIDSAIEAQEEARCVAYHQQQYQEHQHQPSRMGVLGTPIQDTHNYYVDYERQSNYPKPGTTIIHQKAKLTKSSWITKHQLNEHISVQVGGAADDIDVANLRLSVFSEYTVAQIEDWVYRSSSIIRQRRLKGATTLNAYLNYIDEGNRNEVYNWMVGSLECSTHEVSIFLWNKKLTMLSIAC